MTHSVSSLSVVLPAYNEESLIALTIQTCFDYLKGRFKKSEVIVVDDGSKDRTAEIVRDLQETYPDLRLERHETNRGYGEALRTGFNAAKMDWILLMDSDGQFDIAEMEKFLPHTN